DWQYPFKAAALQEAKSSATALRRALADEPELARPVFNASPKGKSSLAANQRGQAMHRVIQLAPFTAFENENLLREQIDNLEKRGLLQPEEAASIEVQSILDFWQSDFGRELLSHRNRLEREVPFTAKFSRADLAAIGAPTKGDL